MIIIPDPEFRPVLVLGPLAECVVDKLVTDFPDKFRKVGHETRHCSQAALDQELADNLIVDYRRKGNYFECTTVSAIRSVCSSVSYSLTLYREIQSTDMFLPVCLNIVHIFIIIISIYFIG